MLQKALVEAPNVDKQAAASRASVATPRGRRGVRRPFPAESWQRIAVAARSLLRSLRPRARRGEEAASSSRGQDSAGLAPKAAAAAQDRRQRVSPLDAPLSRGSSARGECLMVATENERRRRISLRIAALCDCKSALAIADKEVREVLGSPAGPTSVLSLAKILLADVLYCTHDEPNVENGIMVG